MLISGKTLLATARKKRVPGRLVALMLIGSLFVETVGEARAYELRSSQSLRLSILAGQSCSRVGATAISSAGAKLVCRAEGGRLVWRRANRAASNAASSTASWSDTQIVFGGYCGQSMTYTRWDKSSKEIQRVELVKTPRTHAVIPHSYHRSSKTFLFSTFNCSTSIRSLFIWNLTQKNSIPTLVAAYGSGEGVIDAVIDIMTGSVIALTSGSGLGSYGLTQYTSSGPRQIWNAQASGWFSGGYTFPSKLLAGTGQQVFVAGSNSSSSLWRLDSVTRSDISSGWYSQNVLVGRGNIQDVALDSGFNSNFAVYTDLALHICSNFTSIRVVDASSCTELPSISPVDGQRKFVWALDPTIGGTTSLWISGVNQFVNPKSMSRRSVNLTGCIFGCGMDLVNVDETDIELYPNLRSLQLIDDRTIG